MRLLSLTNMPPSSLPPRSYLPLSRGLFQTKMKNRIPVLCLATFATVAVQVAAEPSTATLNYRDGEAVIGAPKSSFNSISIDASNANGDPVRKVPNL
jgi:hypothetical protein